MKTSALVLVLLLGLSSLPRLALAAQPAPDWLTGTWTLCDDPDQSPRDSLQFNADGSGLVIREKGDIEFLHRHADNQVHLLANANGRAIPIELAASPEHDKLLLHSDRTGSTSTYVRVDGPLANQCSVK